MDRMLREERILIAKMVKQIASTGCNVLLIQKSILRDAVNVCEGIEARDVELCVHAFTLLFVLTMPPFLYSARVSVRTSMQKKNDTPECESRKGGTGEKLGVGRSEVLRDWRWGRLPGCGSVTCVQLSAARSPPRGRVRQ